MRICRFVVFQECDSGPAQWGSLYGKLLLWSWRSRRLVFPPRARHYLHLTCTHICSDNDISLICLHVSSTLQRHHHTNFPGFKPTSQWQNPSPLPTQIIDPPTVGRCQCSIRCIGVSGRRIAYDLCPDAALDFGQAHVELRLVFFLCGDTAASPSEGQIYWDSFDQRWQQLVPIHLSPASFDRGPQTWRCEKIIALDACRAASSLR